VEAICEEGGEEGGWEEGGGQKKEGTGNRRGKRKMDATFSLKKKLNNGSSLVSRLHTGGEALGQ